jgi:hypothetical protein
VTLVAIVASRHTPRAVPETGKIENQAWGGARAWKRRCGEIANAISMLV